MFVYLAAFVIPKTKSLTDALGGGFFPFMILDEVRTLLFPFGSQVSPPQVAAHAASSAIYKMRTWAWVQTRVES